MIYTYWFDRVATCNIWVVYTLLFCDHCYVKITGGTQKCFSFWVGIRWWGSSFRLSGEANILNSYFNRSFVVDGKWDELLEMSSSIFPGLVMRWKFLMVFINVKCAGLKHAAWRNWANYFFLLFTLTIARADCVEWIIGVNGISQRPSEVLLSPFMISFSYHPILGGVFWLKWLGIRHHISDQLIIKMHFNVAKIRFSVAAGRSAKVKWPTFCGSIVMLSGSLTQGPMLFGWNLTN